MRVGLTVVSLLLVVLCSYGGDFPLKTEHGVVPVYVDQSEAFPTKRAVGDLSKDIGLVVGDAALVVSKETDRVDRAIVVGQLGSGGFVDELAAQGLIDLSVLQDQWESFIIQEVEEATPFAERTLVIAGSDMRGTIYGIYELSKQMGVSPWYWWADVPVIRNPNAAISGERLFVSSPSVKYRGIFINDEDWGLQPWAAKTFDPKLGDIGPKTYAKVFELLLRLRANCLWPAMHEVTRPFNADGENARLASEYGIVMGSSHAEPMLRNNVREWTLPHKDYNFATHSEEVLDYWNQRVAKNKQFENIYTLGMRGIHDSGMTAGETVEEKKDFLDNIIQKQREILQRNVGGDLRDIPQVFTPYKEVLPIYEAGLEVPEEVTLVWPDDNHGYIRHFATPAEQKRSGGSGIYYHISYLGAPMAYLWLQSTPLGVIWQQMHQAWAYGARDVWILNVGDIKPAEVSMEFFLSLGWDIDRWQPEFIEGFFSQWAHREFGPDHSAEIAEVLSGYFELNFQRRPEHLQWWLPHSRERSSALNKQEIKERLAAFASLTNKAETIGDGLEECYQDAFYQLVLYPIAAADAANQRVFYSELYRNYLHKNTVLREQYGLKARMADEKLEELTRRYNHEISGGKWKHLMAVEPADSAWRSFRTGDVHIPAENMVALSIDADLFPQEDFGGLLQKQAPFKHPLEFEERDGVVAFEAENTSRSVSPSDSSWRTISGAGRSGDAVAVFPETVESLELGDANAASLEYRFTLGRSGELQLTSWLLPTFPVHPANGVRFAVALDDGSPVLVEIHRKVKDANWKQAVLNAAIEVNTKMGFTEAGEHIFRLIQIDPGVVLDKFALHFDPLPKSYLGPRETRKVNK